MKDTSDKCLSIYGFRQMQCIQSAQSLSKNEKKNVFILLIKNEYNFIVCMFLKMTSPTLKCDKLQRHKRKQSFVAVTFVLPLISTYP